MEPIPLGRGPYYKPISVVKNFLYFRIKTERFIWVGQVGAMEEI